MITAAYLNCRKKYEQSQMEVALLQKALRLAARDLKDADDPTMYYHVDLDEIVNQWLIEAQNVI